MSFLPSRKHLDFIFMVAFNEPRVKRLMEKFAAENKDGVIY